VCVQRFGRVLGIWAHPDDESYLAAGVMMRAREFGDRVVCVTATRGELGSTDPQVWPAGPELAKVRTAESEEAMRIFDVSEHHWLDYPDGGVADVDPGQAVERILVIAGDLQPDVITTFAPTGMTGHPDHQTVSRWADEVARRIDPAPLVLHAVHAQSLLDRYLPQLLQLGIFMNDALPDAAPDDQAITVQLSPAERERKLAALRVQTSQTRGLLAVAPPEMISDLFGQESFVTAAVTSPKEG
jgi:LmbE family N-acetylglucosaminyl deacetylase